ncbi:hypothetical protein [Falsibacillus albus]|uniref:Uncharacterized protein n=1 Tax=Falsibacillus albus TaxID=2478915 RepID=A0A3L7JMD0_9BACI|nr:hypothetical protein [Falsibacillus albus]RLQ91630.1 hypothetical protein D9X91_20725 [Falsibacillus albus]
MLERDKEHFGSETSYEENAMHFRGVKCLPSNPLCISKCELSKIFWSWLITTKAFTINADIDSIQAYKLITAGDGDSGGKICNGQSAKSVRRSGKHVKTSINIERTGNYAGSSN